LLGEKMKERETEMYLCGEEYDEKYKLSTDYLFETVSSFFNLKKLRKFHSGNLSSYLYWLVLGTVFIILFLVVLWA